ncbi:fibrohexamerin-like [Trichoplusia ni]|uniref:Fibrohexamerin-like n=1 Tax=Trichoplusia ni TaxID=7111 RepID=A0A7E5W9N5_TRINI|nr:fibrohexamerin-like [Trichoplusia ni]
MLKIYSILLFVGSAVCWAGASGPSHIDRPCDLDDHRCIGSVLASFSNCKQTLADRIQPEYRIKKFRFETPYFNTSYIDNDLIVRNHDTCSVAAFFINKKSKTAVLGIDCRDLYLETERTVIQHRSLQEDNVYHYHVKATYPLIRMTMNLPTSRSAHVCDLPVYTEVPVMPRFHVDPKDRPTAKALSTDDSLQLIFERENFFYRGYPFIRMFLDAHICNFGCPREIL